MSQKSDSSANCSTERRIILAAEKEFLEKGYDGARTTSIAEAAGVTHAMLHYYFRTKEKLFDSIISEKMEMLKDVISVSFDDIALPLEDLIRNLINLHLDFVAANPELPRFLICEIFSKPEQLSFFSQKIMGVAPNVLMMLQQKINDMAADGKCRRIDAKMLMLDIVSLNVFPYVASPMVNKVLDNCMEDRATFLEKRKKENYDTIMRKLRP